MTSHDSFARRFVEGHRAELVAFRRHLHAYPEPSYEERETTDLVAQRLSAAGLKPRVPRRWSAAGLKPRVLDDGCGLLCDIGGRDIDRPHGGGADDGPLIALRADLDALLMDDEKDVPYRSKRAGVAHACGHDVHTTV